MMYDEDYINVAQLGKTVGLDGFMKIYSLSDFPEIIIPQRMFLCGAQKVVVESYNSNRSLIRFQGFESREKASCFVGKFLMCSIGQTREWCHLEHGFFFWFDIINALLFEKDEYLGKVGNIQRIGNIDYLFINVHDELVKQGYSKSFLLPFIDRFILNIEQASLKQYKIYTHGAKDILEAS